MNIIESKEQALSKAGANLEVINRLCVEAKLPPLTAETAVEYYYRPQGDRFLDFYPTLPDGGANSAGAFGISHQIKWEIAVLVTTGQGPARLYAEQDKAAAQFAVVMPEIQKATEQFAALKLPESWFED